MCRPFGRADTQVRPYKKIAVCLRIGIRAWLKKPELPLPGALASTRRAVDEDPGIDPLSKDGSFAKPPLALFEV